MSDTPEATANASARDSTGGWVYMVAGILVLAAFGAYWNSFTAPFLLDDVPAIRENGSIRDLRHVRDVLLPPDSTPTTGRPLLNLSLALNYASGGMSVRGYHVVNLLIHVCAGLALLGIVRRTLLLPGLRARYGEAALPLAACIALLWMLHPLQTGAVTYISQRAESLMGLFYLLTLYGFIRSAGQNLTEGNEGNKASEPENRVLLSSLPSGKISGPNGLGIGWLVLSVIACFCGMATKQVMVTAPVLVLLYDRAFVSGSFRSALRKRWWYYASLAAAWLLLVFLMKHSSLAGVRAGFHAGVGWVTYALTELRVVVDYLKLALWPHPLVFDYGGEILVSNPLTVLPYALILAAILAGVVVAWRRSPMAGFLGCWFFLILAPTSTVVPIAEQPMAESRMYLPLAAVVASVVLLGFSFLRYRALMLLGVAVLGLSALTIRRNHDYRSEVSIWEDTLAGQPGSFRAHNNLANVFSRMPGRFQDAIVHYEEAVRIRPRDEEAQNNLADALAKMPGRMPEALAHFEEALRLKPDFAEGHSNYGIALAQIPGRMPDAIAHYEKALRIRPDFAEVHNNLANALAQTRGRMADAIVHYKEALRLKPAYFEAHMNLANVLMMVPGRIPEAIGHYEEALRLRPDLADVHYCLGNAFMETRGRMADAISHYEAAVRLRPDFAEAHNNLAAAYVETGRLDVAIEQLEITARLRPGDSMVRENLKQLKSMWRR